MIFIIGIYCFRNKENGKRYIGQSININKRFNEHKSHYNNVNHSCYNTKFYRALRKYGLEQFEFSTLEELKNETELNDREIYWISFYDSYNSGYNMTLGGNSSSGEDSPNALLTNEEVYYIREQYKMGIRPPSNVYEEFKDKITYYGFKYIWDGKTYTKINMDVYNLKKDNKRRFGKIGINFVLNIREEYMKGLTYEELVSNYSDVLAQSQIRNILMIESWKQLESIPKDFIPMKRSKNRLLINNVFDIRKEYMDGLSYEEIIKKYKDIICITQIRDILKLKCWTQEEAIPKNYTPIVFTQASNAAKLQPLDVLKIRIDYMNGVEFNTLVKKYPIVKSKAIRRILTLETWNKTELIPEKYNPLGGKYE